MLVSSGDTPDPLHMRSKQVEGWSYLRLVDEDESKFMGEGGKGQGELSDLNQVVYCKYKKLYTYFNSIFSCGQTFCVPYGIPRNTQPPLSLSTLATVQQL